MKIYIILDAANSFSFVDVVKSKKEALTLCKKLLDARGLSKYTNDRYGFINPDETKIGCHICEECGQTYFFYKLREREI